MFFSKKPVNENIKSEPLLEWEKYSQTHQSLWVSVSRWDYKVFPSTKGSEFGSWLFQFEGRTNLGAAKGLTVAGGIEVIEPGEEHGMLQDHWKNPPNSIEGYGCLMHEKHDPVFMASFGFTLLCKQEALDWLYKAFMCGFASQNGGIGLEIGITFPDEMGEDFWKDRWRDEWWQVTNWKVFAGAGVRDK